MSTELIKRLKESRALEVKLGEITFYGECPLYGKCMGVINKYSGTTDPADIELAAISVNGWSGVTEADIIVGGDPSKDIEFDRELFNILIHDRSDWWKAVSAKVSELVQQRQIVKESEVKN